jgi:hypothetical protein
MQVNSDQSLERGSVIYRHFGSWDAVRRAAREQGWSFVLESAGLSEADPDERPTYTGRIPATMMRSSNPR